MQEELELPSLYPIKQHYYFFQRLIEIQEALNLSFAADKADIKKIIDGFLINKIPAELHKALNKAAAETFNKIIKAGIERNGRYNGNDGLGKFGVVSANHLHTRLAGSG